ncbi:MAG: PAS domain S-box protein [Planctomycetia bacterium]|nr:PAS domain S-box protein [Planctomycetia bacterium]
MFGKNEELVAIHERMTDGILVTETPSNRFVRTNPAMCRMTGYSEEELLAMCVDDLHPRESLGEVREVFRRMVEDRSVAASGMPVLRKDGTVIYCDIAANHLERDGRRYAIGFFHDVTERRQAAEALKRSEARFRAVFEGAALGLGLVDFDGRFIEVNEAYAGFTGYSREELVGRSIGEVTHPEDRPEEEHRISNFLASGRTTCQYEKRMLHKDGGILWIHVSASLLPGTCGLPRMFLGVVENVTDRRHAEQALAESEETLRGLVENMPDIVFMVDRKWTILYINRGSPEIPLKDIVGGNALRHCPPEHHPQLEAVMQRAIEEHKVQTVDVVDVFGRSWSCRLVPMVEKGQARNFLMIATDVSQRRVAEKAIMDEQELLRKLLDLFERDRELVAFEIHDGFSQQLTGALLNFEAAAEVYKQASPTAIASFDNGVRLLRESIAESRRLVRGLRPPVLDEYGIVPAIEHLIEDHLAAGGANVEFVSGITTQRLARPLESAMFRMVQETLNNIRQHSRSDRTRIELTQKGPSVRLEVRDWGIGFDPEKVGADHFGLRGIRERARLLGGRAEIESSPGKGTRVSIELPMIAATPMPE